KHEVQCTNVRQTRPKDKTGKAASKGLVPQAGRRARARTRKVLVPVARSSPSSPETRAPTRGVRLPTRTTSERLSSEPVHEARTKFTFISIMTASRPSRQSE